MDRIGYLGRMDPERVVKKIFESKPEGRTRLRRPRLR
jgi:streptogramin lyase